MTKQNTLLEELTEIVEYAASVFNDTCDCGECGPCKMLERMSKVLPTVEPTVDCRDDGTPILGTENPPIRVQN